jgi:alkylhydroperoxidase/carboxymuconolactone decarboxylase family protein YurZ
MKHTDRAGNRKWTLSALREALTNHGWLVTEEELRQAITHLLQTEHVEAVVAGNRTDYKFTGRDRVQIVDNPIEEAAS